MQFMINQIDKQINCTICDFAITLLVSLSASSKRNENWDKFWQTFFVLDSLFHTFNTINHYISIYQLLLSILQSQLRCIHLLSYHLHYITLSSLMSDENTSVVEQTIGFRATPPLLYEAL